MVTIKRVDVTSAMKVGALLNALGFTVFGIIFLLLQSWLISTITSSVSTSGGGGSFNSSAFAVAGLAGCLITYVIGIVFSALAGAIIGAVYAFFYNLIANWAGGLRIELDVPPQLEKPKRLDPGDEFRF